MMFICLGTLRQAERNHPGSNGSLQQCEWKKGEELFLGMSYYTFQNHSEDRVGA